MSWTKARSVSLFVFCALGLLAGPEAGAAGPIDLCDLVQIQATIDVRFSNYTFNRRTGATTTDVTLTNVSPQDIPPPVYLAIQDISSQDATVANAHGVDAHGVPFFVVGSAMVPGQSITFNVVFANTGRSRFTFNAMAFGVVADLFVSIESPPSLTLTNEAMIDVSGKTTPGAVVTVNGLPAAVAGDTWSVLAVPLLREGANNLSALAQDGMGGTATVAIQVTRDTTPPTVMITSPLAGKVLFTDMVSVTGSFNDPVAGLVSDEAPTATVNGLAAAVANGAFVRHGVALLPGPNTITARVTDQAGNFTEQMVQVTFDASAVKKIVPVSGNDQTAPISTGLALPLVAQLQDEAGLPVAGEAVVFRVKQGNGVFDDLSRAKAVVTDGGGLVSTPFIVGSRTGQGCNRVEATAAGFEGAAVFVSTSTGGGAAKINVSQGEMQVGEVGLQASIPLVAIVSDVGNNPLSGVKVIFQMVLGGGHFPANGTPTLGVTTDMTGRVTADFVLGPLPGIDSNVVHATIEENPGASPAIFAITGVESGDPAATSFSGIVLGHTDTALPGATVSMDGFGPVAVTDGQGQFALGPGVPTGPHHLHVDGMTVTVPGMWASLTYDVNVIAGIDNTLGMPVHLLPLTEDCPIANPNTDVTITLPEIEGFSLTVFAGSATFIDGSSTGKVSVTQVRTDKIPMPPADGMSPNFIITIQPPDMHLDPPGRISYPNVEGLQPGEETNLFSFDHDLGRFVSIGPGTCSEDGTVITSNPGYGIVKGGWHCAGPSRPQGHAQPPKATLAQASKNQKTCINENVSFTATGMPTPGMMGWSGGEMPATGAGNTFNTKYTTPGKRTVTAKWTCESGAMGTDSTDVTVFKVTFQEDRPCSGFDGSVDPPWLVVPKGGMAKAKAIIDPASEASCIKFMSAATGTATVSPMTASGSPETLTVTGVAKAVTMVTAKAGTKECAKLNITVKDKKTIKVAFHFISDSSGTTTNRDPAIADGLITTMNEIWTPQANVCFVKHSVDSPVVAKDMGDVVRFSRHLEGPPDNVPAGEHDWDDVIAKLDTTADWNVYFVWEYEQDTTPSTDNTDAAQLTGHALFEDSAGTEIGETLAHEAGHFLGITPSDYADKVDELMHAITDVRGCIIRKAQADQANP